jgi:FAD/FMN-containing dehydrogenase
VRSSPVRIALQRAQWVDDVHSRSNKTRVGAVATPRGLEELCELVALARERGRKLSVAGGRHAMGGQQFSSGDWLIDTRRLVSGFELDAESGRVSVAAGVQWPELVARLLAVQGDRAGVWTIAQKQTGADRLSLGGALASNVHGRGLRMRPISGDVESLDLVDPSGVVRTCDRKRNRELFQLAIGGYGLFGVIARVRLRLVRRCKLVRRVELARSGDVIERLESQARSGARFGDFQFAVDDRSEAFLREGILSCYFPVDDDAPIVGERAHLGERDWRRLLLLAHIDKSRAFAEYAAHYRRTDGRAYWADLAQLGTYVGGYHERVDSELGHRGSEMISELFVPRGALEAFLVEARARLRRLRADVIYGTVRLIERDDETRLAWARERWACVVFNLHVERSNASRAVRAFRSLIDAARELGGSYYLTYHRWATPEQVTACHPRLASVLQRKRELDPEELFTSDWYRHHRRLAL